MFNRILIANRGEIACRIIKTARRLGIETVAVYSEADRNSRHVRLADQAILIGPAASAQSYLSIEKIIAAAKTSGAEAIHPGYGFLSENTAFRQACDDADIVFIGPPTAAIKAMGSKSAAKKLMETANVPLTPGYHGDNQDADFLKQQADQIGYPVLIKAAAGGGGKGMRLVERTEDFAASLVSCKQEASASFGDDLVLIEKYITQPRHVEIQIFADQHGNCVHLFERDCSVQRRHQKILEEAPAPGLSAELRNTMGEAAVKAAQATGYVGAGTVEFIMGPAGNFYFMEMNTRLQVEHPVTEMITGQDLVEWQLRVAAGQPLPLSQDQLHVSGHAIEARIYAESPDKDFMPATGKLLHYHPPANTRYVRVDSGVEEGDAITPFYDPMIAKLIVWDEDRDNALARMLQALKHYEVAGVQTNIQFLSRLVGCPAFMQADLDTALITRQHDHLFVPPTPVPDTAFAALAVSELLREASQHNTETSPWAINDNWRSNLDATRLFAFQHDDHNVIVSTLATPQGWRIDVNGQRFTADGNALGDQKFRVCLDGRCQDLSVVSTEHQRHVFYDGQSWLVHCTHDLPPQVAQEQDDKGLQAPMPGIVVALLAEAGSHVTRNTPLLTLSAMKMEYTISAPSDGVIRKLLCAVGDQVDDGADLIEFEPSAA